MAHSIQKIMAINKLSVSVWVERHGEGLADRLHRVFYRVHWPACPPAEQDRRDSNAQFINEALTKILLDCVRPTADPHVHSGSGLACTVERLANASCYEVERRVFDLSERPSVKIGDRIGGR
jgi:hypothetical protein